jgi:hypothetical protein
MHQTPVSPVEDGAKMPEAQRQRIILLRESGMAQPAMRMQWGFR